MIIVPYILLILAYGPKEKYFESKKLGIYI
jgi:hypothetical protein